MKHKIWNLTLVFCTLNLKRLCLPASAISTLFTKNDVDKEIEMAPKSFYSGIIKIKQNSYIYLCTWSILAFSFWSLSKILCEFLIIFQVFKIKVGRVSNLYPITLKGSACTYKSYFYRTCFSTPFDLMAFISVQDMIHIII